jgi:hypothetical protein
MIRSLRSCIAVALLAIQATPASPQAVAGRRLTTARTIGGTIAIEAESLLSSAGATGGRPGRQDMRPFGSSWSGGAQLFWAAAGAGAKLHLRFATAVAGRYRVFLAFTRAPDYGVVQARIDSAPALSFNGYAPVVTRGRTALGVLELEPHEHQLILRVHGKAPQSTGFFVGLDRIELEPVAAPVPARTTQPPASGATNAGAQVQAITGPKIAGPRLAFALFSANGAEATLGPVERNVYRPDLTVSLTYQAGSGGELTYRWQVQRQPFPRELTPNLSPSGLLAAGPAVLDGTLSFRIALGGFPPLGTGTLSTGSGPVQIGRVSTAGGGSAPVTEARTRPGGTSRRYAGVRLADQPIDFYIRVVPVLNGTPAGPASNVVIAHFLPGKNDDRAGDALAKDAERKKRLAEMREAARVYQLQIVKFTPMVFQDPNRWGCINVISNPQYGTITSPIATYAPGEHCGEVFTGDKSYQADDAWDVVTGWAKAYDVMATFYDDAKAWVAHQVAELAPCEAMGDKLEDTCEGFVAQATGAAISAGLAAAGVPPTLPNLDELDDAAKGKVAEAAANYTCDEFESRGGQCTPEMRKALAAAYKKGLDQIQLGVSTAAREPGCEDVEAAHEHGREPLPCFTKYGATVEPATGAATEPASVTIRVRRSKPDPSFVMPPCVLRADLQLRNQLPKVNLHGVDYGPAQLDGNPFQQPESGIPALAVGQQTDITLVFSRYRPFAVPGDYSPGLMWFEDWLYLYQGGTGPLSASVSTAAPVPGAVEFNGKEITLECASLAETRVQIPR